MEGAKMGTRPYRLGAFLDGVGWIEHTFGRLWQREEHRIVAAPDAGHVELILRLADCLEEPFRLRYVLLVPRDGQEDGRFDLPQLMSRDELRSFLLRYRELIEEDGRHHVKIFAQPGASIVYDQHNVLYLHGPLDRFETVLREHGLREGIVEFPSPHSHHYHEELDALLEDMLERYDWQWQPHEGLN